MTTFDEEGIGGSTVSICLTNRSLALLIAIAALCVVGCAEKHIAEPRAEIAREPLAELVAYCAPSAVDCLQVSVSAEGEPERITGSGTIIHEAGFILTNAHVLGSDKNMMQIHGGGSYPRQLMVGYSQYDLGIIKIDADEPLTAMKVGRSHDLMPGEPVFTIGNPSGLRHSVSDGVISRRTPVDGPFDTVQCSTAVNGGNSGCALINFHGELIGVIQANETGQENMGYAIPADLVRACVGMLLPDRRNGCWLGVQVDVFGPARVTVVEPGSPADKAGVKVGDVVRRAGDMRVDDGVHYVLALYERKPGEAFPLEVERDGKRMTFNTIFDELPLQPALDVPDVVNGLAYTVYRNAESLAANDGKVYRYRWKKPVQLKLSDLDGSEVVETGRTETFSLPEKKDRDPFSGSKFCGYLEMPEDGAYTFTLASAMGSQLWIDDLLIVNNDFGHSMSEWPGLARLRAGKHAVTVTTFGTGVTVFCEGPNMEKAPVGPATLYTEPSR